MSLRVHLAAVLSLVCMTAQSESPKPKPPLIVVDHCEKEVRAYLEALQFIRETAGSDIVGRVTADYVDEKVVREVRDKQGMCAAAELIRTKTASRKN